MLTGVRHDAHPDRYHRVLGPGLLESAYEVCLAHELEQRGHTVVRQVVLPVVYSDMRLDAGYRVDLIVDGVVIVEIKSVEALAPVHEAQVSPTSAFQAVA